ncbi:hypothetical protein MPLA_1390005 [Mesorhizobium sp. ORS 3359]|nr:hypothetical protein MPLA_1390005 [Mesorhizobium sp. ORS 3359]
MTGGTAGAYNDFGVLDGEPRFAGQGVRHHLVSEWAGIFAKECDYGSLEPAWRRYGHEHLENCRHASRTKLPSDL